MNAKKIIIIGVSVLSIALIVFAALVLTGTISLQEKEPSDEELFLPRNLEDSWTSPELGDEKALMTISVYDNEIAGFQLTEKSGSGISGFFPINVLTEGTYEKGYGVGAVCWSGLYTDKNYIFGSIVPQDCEYALIEGKKFESQSITLTANGKEYNVKYITAVLGPLKPEVKAVLVDSNGEEHVDKG